MKKKLIVLQDGYKECGASCLLSIIRYYGGNQPIGRLIDLTNTTKNGTDFYNLKVASNLIGLSSKSYKISDINKIKEINVPFICQVINNNYEHFIVVYEVNNKNVVVMDPAVGKRVLTINDLNEIWTGYIMIFSPYKSLAVYNNRKYLNKIIIDVLNNNKSLILNILFLSIIFTIFSCVYAFYSQIIIDKIIDTNISNLIVITFVFSIILILKTLASLFRNLSLIYINQKLDLSMFLKTFNKILLLPYNYYKNRTTGEVISRINDLSSVKNLISKIILTVFLDFIIAFVCSIVLVKISLEMFLLLMIIILGYIIIYFIFRPVIKKYTNIIQENNSQINSKLVESISGFETIKNLNLESEIGYDMEKIYLSSLNSSFKFDTYNSYVLFMEDVIYLLGTLLISFIGYKLVMMGDISIGSVITFISIMPYFIDPIKNIIDISKESFYSLNAVKRVNDLFEIDCDDFNKSNNLILRGDIKINNLCFSYDKNINVLNNINLDIKLGDKILLLGSSGTGKSTILKLLYKYYSIDRGMIYIDGFDINDYSLSEIRKKIVYISQDETLFTETIKENIIKGRYNKDFYEVCNITYVDKIVNNLFLGYDTKLEENGSNISSGQRQRIVLARALLKEANIILIDEGLNAVDINLERNILLNLFHKYREKTFVIISHRIQNMDLYNKVVELKDGQIKENSMYVGELA